jgi:hypothetical protein
MARNSKSLGRKNNFDKFYTKKEIALNCINLLNIDSYDVVIEPSAGSGSFSNQISNCLAYDLEPENIGIIKQDWFTLDKSQFKNNVLVIGNPPFGEQNNLAIKFFNEAAKCAKTIAFILPLSFKKNSIKNSLDLNFHLKKEYIIPKNSFTLEGKDYSVPCVFQVWEKEKRKREKILFKKNSKYIDFVTKKDKPDFRIQRVGGNAGKASIDLNFAESSNYFIKNKTKIENKVLINLINKINYDSVSFTVGPKSLSKDELITSIDSMLDNIVN